MRSESSSTEMPFSSSIHSSVTRLGGHCYSSLLVVYLSGIAPPEASPVGSERFSASPEPVHSAPSAGSALLSSLLGLASLADSSSPASAAALLGSFLGPGGLLLGGGLLIGLGLPRPAVLLGRCSASGAGLPADQPLLLDLARAPTASPESIDARPRVRPVSGLAATPDELAAQDVEAGQPGDHA